MLDNLMTYKELKQCLFFGLEILYYFKKILLTITLHKHGLTEK